MSKFFIIERERDRKKKALRGVQNRSFGNAPHYLSLALIFTQTRLWCFKVLEIKKAHKFFFFIIKNIYTNGLYNIHFEGIITKKQRDVYTRVLKQNAASAREIWEKVANPPLYILKRERKQKKTVTYHHNVE